MHEPRNSREQTAAAVDDGEAVGEVLHGEEECGAGGDGDIDCGVPDGVAGQETALAVRGAADGVDVVAELAAGVDVLEEDVDALCMGIAEARGEQVFRGVGQAVAGDADVGEAGDVAETIGGKASDGQRGEGGAERDVVPAGQEAKELPGGGELSALVERSPGVGERGTEATGDAGRDDLVFKTHPEEGGFGAEFAGKVYAGTCFVVPAQLGIEIDGSAGVVVDDVFDAGRSEAAMEASEKGDAAANGVGGTEAGDPLGEAGVATGSVEVVDAAEVDGLKADARSDSEIAEDETILHEEGRGVGVAVIVFDQDAVAGSGARTIPLQTFLHFGVVADAEIEFVADLAQIESGFQFRVDAPGVIVAEAAFVAAGGEEIRHAAAGWVGYVVGALVGVAGLAPPVAEEGGGVAVGGENEMVGEGQGVGDGTGVTVGVEEVVAEVVRPGAGEKLVFAKAAVGEVRILSVGVEAEAESLARGEAGEGFDVEVCEAMADVVP